MITSGKIDFTAPFTQKPEATAYIKRLLKTGGLEVTDDTKGNLLVDLPALDVALFPALQSISHESWWLDRLILNVSEGGQLCYKVVYWTPIQIMLHAIVSVLLAFQFFSSQNSWPLFHFIGLFALGNLVPLFVFLITVQYPQLTRLERALKRRGLRLA